MNPQRTHASKLGKLAERLVAAEIERQGWVFHTVESGNDFGVDGRVEIVESEGMVTGLEFLVQVKASQDLLKDSPADAVRLGRYRLDTVLYWFAKYVPVLLVSYSAATEELFYGWLHEEVPPDRLLSALRADTNDITVTVPRVCRLEARAWRQIEKEVRHVRDVFNGLIEAAVPSRDGLLLYRAIADALDFLHEWLVSLSLAQPELRAVARKGPDATLAVRQEVAAHAHEHRLLTPPSVSVHGPAWFLGAVGLACRSLEAFANSTSSELVRVDLRLAAYAAATAARIEQYLFQGMGEVNRENLRQLLQEPDPDVEYVYFKPPPSISAFEQALGLVSLELRDFLRIMRDICFPPVPERRRKNPLRQFRRVAETVLRNAADWSPQGTEVGLDSEEV